MLCNPRELQSLGWLCKYARRYLRLCAGESQAVEKGFVYIRIHSVIQPRPVNRTQFQRGREISNGSHLHIAKIAKIAKIAIMIAAPITANVAQLADAGTTSLGCIGCPRSAYRMGRSIRDCCCPSISA